MIRNNRSLFAVLTLVVSACASPGAQKKVDNHLPVTMLVCRMERPTGSNIAEPVCRKDELSEEDRRNVEQIVQKPHVQIEKGN